jgi:hypothetical protein
VDRNVLGRGVQPGNRADCLDQRFPVMRPGAADERAVDVEQYQGAGFQNRCAEPGLIALRCPPETGTCGRKLKHRKNHARAVITRRTIIQ